MTNRIPLIINSSSQLIQELPSGDNLDLSSSDISNVGNITVALTSNLGLIGNVKITGGASGDLITTDGIGNLSFTGTANVANYAGNVTIASQPNITSVGTLTSLNVNGSITGSNNLALYGNGGAMTANISVTNYYTTTANTFNFGFAQSRGTRTSPSAVTAGDDIFAFTTAVYTGNGTASWDGTTGWKTIFPVRSTITSQPTGSNVWYGSNVRFTTSSSVANTTYTCTFDDAGGFTVPGTMASGNVLLSKFNETVGSSTNTSTSISPDVSTATIFRYTANANFTFNTLTNSVAGSSATVIITQDGTGSRTLTSTMKFAGGSKTLSTTAGSIDIIGVFYDGTTYYASLVKGYA